MAVGLYQKDSTVVTLGPAEVFVYDEALARDVNMGWSGDVSVTLEWDENRALASSAGSTRRLIKRAVAEERVRVTAQLFELSSENLERILPLFTAYDGITVPIYGERVDLTGVAASNLRHTNLGTGANDVNAFRIDGTALTLDTGTIAVPNNDGHIVVDEATGQVARVAGFITPLPDPVQVVLNYNYTDATARVIEGGGAICSPAQERRYTFYHLRDTGQGECGPVIFTLQRGIVQSPITIPFQSGGATVMDLTFEGLTDDDFAVGSQLWRFIEATPG